MNHQSGAATAVLVCLSAISGAQEITEGSTEASDVATMLDEVVVVGRAVTTTSSRIEVERELLLDTAGVLKDIPGANVNRNGTVTGIAQYRGMYGDRVAVSLDDLGVTSGGPNAMDTPLSYASPMITEELVVDRGIASVSSAPESIGGHVNTKLARGQFGNGRAVSGTLGTRYSGNGDISTSAARLTTASDHHRLSLVSEIDRGNDIETPAGVIRPSSVNRDRYDLSYAYRDIDRNVLVFAGKMDTRDTGTAALPMDIRYIRTDLYGIQFDERLSDVARLTTRLAYNDVTHLMDNFTLRDAPAPMRYRQNLAEGSGVQFRLAAVFGNGDNSLTMGFDGVMSDHDSVISNPNAPSFEITNFASVERNLTGLFAEWQRKFDTSEIEFGLRYKEIRARAGRVGASGMPAPMGESVGSLADAFNSSRRDLSWNAVDAVIKLRRSVSDRLEWIVEVGSKTRAPSYQEMYLWLPMEATGGLADGRTYIGDLGLSHERSNEVVVGLTTVMGPFTLSPQIYYRNINDYIQGIPSTNMLANMVSTMMTGQGAQQFANVDAERRGADLAWKLDLDDHWSVDGIASYSRGRRTDVVDNLYRIAPANGSVGLTYSSGRWSFRPEVVLYARQKHVSAYNEESESAGYGLINLSVAWTPMDDWRIEARVDNLAGRVYQDHLAGINRASGSDIPPGVRLFGADRTLSAGVVWDF